MFASHDPKPGSYKIIIILVYSMQSQVVPLKDYFLFALYIALFLNNFFCVRHVTWMIHFNALRHFASFSPPVDHNMLLFTYMSSTDSLSCKQLWQKELTGTLYNWAWEHCLSWGEVSGEVSDKARADRRTNKQTIIKSYSNSLFETMKIHPLWPCQKCPRFFFWHMTVNTINTCKLPANQLHVEKINSCSLHLDSNSFNLTIAEWGLFWPRST